MAKKQIKPVIVPGSSTRKKLANILRYGVIVCLAFLVIRGVVSIFNPTQIVNTYSETSPVVSSEAQSFAQAFAKAYYTFDGEISSDQYLKQLEAFAVKGILADTAGMASDQVREKTNVISTLPWKVSKTSETTADIDVRVEIEKFIRATGEDSAETKTFFRLLRVPIAYNGTGFYVNDYPTNMPDVTAVSGEVATYPSLMEATEVVKEQVNQSLTDFFASYSVDPPSKLKYFMADGNEIQGFNRTILFKSIPELRVYLPEETTQTALNEMVYAYVTSEWEDAEGFKQLQHHTFTLIYRDERWLIQTFRGGFHS